MERVLPRARTLGAAGGRRLVRLHLIVVLLLLPSAAAQIDGPGVVVLVHHPDDGVDPLGVPMAGSDTFLARHGHLDRFAGGVDYPGFVVDGRVPYSGLAEPTGRDAVADTLGVYAAAVQMRHGVETPATLRVEATLGNGSITLAVDVEAHADLGEQVRLWTAVVEDRVHYRPPAGLTNGVFVHPFTVRSVTDHGLLPVANVTLALDPAWNLPETSVAVWLQQGSQDGRFKSREVLQATSHPVLRLEPTLQAGRGVLVEGYSATWCEPCLIGDLALERLAVQHGLSDARGERETGPTYFQPPAHAGPVVLLVALAFAVGALVRLPERRP